MTERTIKKKFDPSKYGLHFCQISNGDYLKLRSILSNPSGLKEAHFIEDPDHDPTLIVKIE